MNNWRNRILREFNSHVARLTLVADPDSLLLEKGISSSIRERGYDLISFEDSVAFRYAYESRFRSRWDQGERADLVVILCSGASDLGRLPYDLLQAGRRLSFSLGEMFPNLSYPVMAGLDRADLDALYEAQQWHAPGVLGENATKEFVLRHVFDIAPELIRKPSDLLHTLLRRHYREQRMPAMLAERFAQLLRQQDGFHAWPLETIIPDREAFFAFLQERWPIFLDRVAKQDSTGIHENAEPFGFEFPGPSELPFGHDDIRIYIDNFFLEGLLEAVPHEQAESLSRSWLAIGIQTDDQADRTRRVEGLLEALSSKIPKENTQHGDWFYFAKTWAELVALVLDSDAKLPEPARQKMEALQARIDVALASWLARHYAGLVNLPPDPPVMLHHIPRFLSRRINDAKKHKAALVLVDGLSLDQWIVIRNELARQRPKYRFRENTVFAWIPTITSVFASGGFYRKAAHLLSQQHPYHGQGADALDAVLGGPRAGATGSRIRQGAGRRPAGNRRGDDCQTHDTGHRFGCRQSGQDHAWHGTWRCGNAQPSPAVGQSMVHGEPCRSALGK